MAAINEGSVISGKGRAGTIHVGTITQGTNYNIINSGTATDAVFDFTFPPGGPPGPGIDNTVIEYAEGASTGATPTNWSTTIPIITTVGNYLWTRLTFHYTDGSTEVAYTRVQNAVSATGKIDNIVNI